MRSLEPRRSLGIAWMFAALTAGACGDASRPFAPSNAHDARSPRAAASANGANSEYVEVPIEFEDLITGFACLDEPVLFHVKGVYRLNSTTSPSGVISTRVFFAVDRPNTWVIYKGVTYTVAQGRQTGQDDVGHTLVGPGDLYIESGVEPDFEVAATGERLRLNFQWQIVIDRDGNVRVSKVTGSCPLDFLS